MFFTVKWIAAMLESFDFWYIPICIILQKIKNELQVHLGSYCTVQYNVVGVQYSTVSVSVSVLLQRFLPRKIVSFLPVITIITFGRCAATPTFTLVLGLTLQYLSFFDRDTNSRDILVVEGACHLHRRETFSSHLTNVDLIVIVIVWTDELYTVPLILVSSACNTP